MKYEIPFNKPSVVGKEIDWVLESIAEGHISGDGPFTKRAERKLQDELGIERVLLTTSCTHALEMSAMLLELQPGDEVIVPSFTFVSTANAFVGRGVKPIFVDVRPDTLNLDEKRLEEAISPRCKAIVLVHYAGVACEMDAIMEIADRHGLVVIEDNAHGLYAKYRGKYLGTFGAMATQSFHETKNFTCGEGGALLLQNPELIQRAEIIREKGTNRARFFRGQVDKYTWVDHGSSYVLADLLAAYLSAQLERRETIQGARSRIWQRYMDSLQGWAGERGIAVPTIPEHCEQSYHLFYMLMPSREQQQQLIAHLRTQSILSVFHYLPLHLSPMGLKHGSAPGGCPVTEDISGRLLRLPFYASLSETEQSRVIESILSFRAQV